MLAYLTVFLAVLSCVALGVWFLPRIGDGFGESKSLIPHLQGNEESLVKDYLLRNANDPSSLEIAEWGEPRFVLISEPVTIGQELTEIAKQVWERDYGKGPPPPPVATSEVLGSYKPGIIIHVRFRAKNAFGAKMLGERLFLIRDGKIVRSEPVGEGELRGVPHDFAYNHALGLLGGIAAERVGGKLTRVIVRGQISYQGKPLRMTKGPQDESLRVSFVAEGTDFIIPNSPGIEGAPAITVPPRYEISGIPPGKYLVTVGWVKPNPNPTGPGTHELDMLDGAYSAAKTKLSCVVTDKQEIQYFDFDLKPEKVR